jgi:hypothetical protein
MKITLIAIAALSLPMNIAAAAVQLTPAQLDTITAGQILGVDCPGCTLSSATSTSTNGVTVTTSSTVTVPGGTGGGTGGTGGGTGGTGGGTGGTGGGTGGGETGNGSAGAPSVQTTVPIPGNLTGVITSATTPTVIKP